MLPSFKQLVAKVSPTNALANILAIANNLGLQTTAWQPLGMARTIMATLAQVVSAAFTNVNLIAQGGYATTAAAMVDAFGSPITTWMDLVAQEVYGLTRNPAVGAAGPVVFANVTNVYRGPFAPGTFHLRNPFTGATYTNSDNFAIDGTSSPPTPFDSTGNFVADAAFSGSSGTAAMGTILIMVTPIPGVSVVPLASSLVGTDAETNAALLARCINKLGSISPNGASQALVYVATTPTIIANYGSVSAPVTRALQVPQIFPTTGLVNLYIANADGEPPGGDVTIVQAAEQALAVPVNMTLEVIAAPNQFLVITGTIYVTGNAGTIAADALAALDEYLATIPIGGTNGSTAGEVPISGILSAIQSVATTITEIDLITPTSNIGIGQTNVPVLDPSSAFTVVVVSA